VDTGIRVKGDYVVIYGLAVEHVQKDMTIWDGQNGMTCFYQSELPYDAPPSYQGIVGYRVNEAARHHEGYGIGVYCYFRKKEMTALEEVEEDLPLIVEKGISVHCASVNFINSFSRWLNGVEKSGIRRVINDQGELSTSGDETKRLHFVPEFQLSI